MYFWARRVGEKISGRGLGGCGGEGGCAGGRKWGREEGGRGVVAGLVDGVGGCAGMRKRWGGALGRVGDGGDVRRRFGHGSLGKRISSSSSSSAYVSAAMLW